MNRERRTPGRFALALPLVAALIGGCSLPRDTRLATAPLDATAAADVPFRLTLEPFKIKDLPGLHSVAHAVYQDQNATWLVIVAGRTNGMHAFLPQREAGSIWSFPPQSANKQLYLVDLERRSVVAYVRVDCPPGNRPDQCLPSRIARQLTATNTQSFTRDEWFYIVGGYGVTEDGKSMRTFDQVVALDLAKVVAYLRFNRSFPQGYVLDKTFATERMRAGDHPALAVAGGGIEQLGDKTLLVFGQMFNGLYTTDGGVAQQEYSQAVRMVSIKLAGGKASDGVPGITVEYQGKCPDPDPTKPQPLPDGPYHRRDFTLARVLAPDGSPRIAAFGGVFKGGRMEGYVHPVYITPAAAPAPCVAGGPTLPFTLAEDGGSSQLLSQYESAIIPVYSTSRKAMYTTSYGGISQFHWDGHALKRDAMDFSKKPPVDGLPFINSISTLRVGGAGNGDFLHVDRQGTALTFPPAGGEPSCSGVKAPYLGSNSWFVMAKDLPLRNGVLLLDEIKSPTVIGYIFGGIASTLPYPGDATCASDMVYAVTLDPGEATATARLEEPFPVK